MTHEYSFSCGNMINVNEYQNNAKKHLPYKLQALTTCELSFSEMLTKKSIISDNFKLSHIKDKECLTSSQGKYCNILSKC